ncbi:MAG: putative toxin-antitoxin system toxin component, PIN family [Anaerolineae bacterium]
MIAAVVDSSVYVSAMLTPSGRASEVVRGLRAGRFVALYSAALLDELRRVLSEPRMAIRFLVRPEDVDALCDLLTLRGLLVQRATLVRVCRDPNDDMVLEAALAGNADAIVTADKDLLSLHPFRGIPIIDPTAFLRMLE